MKTTTCIEKIEKTLPGAGFRQGNHKTEVSVSGGARGFFNLSSGGAQRELLRKAQSFSIVLS